MRCVAHPHAGLNELRRVGRNSAIFIESQDSFLHSIGKFFGRNADFEPAGNYVYRWKRREVEKIALSSHEYGYTVKTYFLPIMIRMHGIVGNKKTLWQKILGIINWFFSSKGNLMIVIIFKRKPELDQISYLKDHNYFYKDITLEYPKYITLRE